MINLIAQALQYSLWKQLMTYMKTVDLFYLSYVTEITSNTYMIRVVL